MESAAHQPFVWNMHVDLDIDNSVPPEAPGVFLEKKKVETLGRMHKKGVNTSSKSKK